MTLTNSQDFEASRFFLEASNWNLQNAIESFFENGNETAQGYQQQQQQIQPPSMVLVNDTTIHNKDGLSPGAMFKQSWCIKNEGDQPWPNATWYIYIYIYIHVHIYTQQKHMYVYKTYTYIHTNMHQYIHQYIHTFIPSLLLF